MMSPVIKALILGGFVVALVVAVALLGFTKEGVTMDKTRSAVGIPPIDAAAPAATETATFALG